MDFYLDVEATQFGEIIAIGIVADNNNTFSSLVKPRLSEMNQYISDLTHIKPDVLQEAEDIDAVMSHLWSWLLCQESNIVKWHFFSYGDDAIYFKTTLPAVTDGLAYVAMSVIITALENKTKEVFKHFNGSLHLIEAWNYIKAQEKKQRHDPLEDAQMFKEVLEYVKNSNSAEVIAAAGIKTPKSKDLDPEHKPKGHFWARPGKRFINEIEFNNIDEAITWYIGSFVNEPDWDKVDKNRIMAKIMKAVRTNTKYNNYYWRRVK